MVVSVWLAYQTVRLARAAERDQARARSVQQRREWYQRWVIDSANVYLRNLVAETLPLVDSALEELDRLRDGPGTDAEIRLHVAGALFRFRELRRAAFFPVATGAEVCSPALVRKLNRAQEELEDGVAALLRERAVAEKRTGRRGGSPSVTGALRKHAVAVLHAVLEYAPEDGEGTRAAA